MTLSCIQQPHQHLQANLEGGVLTLAINRPEAKNALYGELYLWIAKALDEADQNKDVRVIVLRGAEHDFTAGNDMKDFMGFVQNPNAGPAGQVPPFVLLKSAARLSKPLIIAVKGVAIGIGVTILLQADLVFADNTASFKFLLLALGFLLKVVQVNYWLNKLVITKQLNYCLLPKSSMQKLLYKLV